MNMNRNKSLALVTLIYLVYYLVFRLDLLCNKGELNVESSGKQLSYIAIKNCSRTVHGMTKDGIHVIGLGKHSSESVHVGFIEDFNRIEKLKEMDESLNAMAAKHRYVGITTNGGTHKKPALTRLRDDIALEVLSPQDVSPQDPFSLVAFFTKYDMGKFLSVEHGSYMPYIMVYDTKTAKKVSERIGPMNGTIKQVVNM